MLVQRLSALDYGLVGRPWPKPPTGSERVAASEPLGIDNRILPKRVYKDAAEGFPRFFPFRLLGGGNQIHEPKHPHEGYAQFVRLDVRHQATGAERVRDPELFCPQGTQVVA